MNAGKGDKNRVRDLRKFQAGYDAIDWSKPAIARARKRIAGLKRWHRAALKPNSKDSEIMIRCMIEDAEETLRVLEFQNRSGI